MLPRSSTKRWAACRSGIAAVVLCLLEGMTPEQAARHLGWPVGTVHSRLARGRERLRGRLTRRGLMVPAGLRATASMYPKAGVAVVPAASRRDDGPSCVEDRERPGPRRDGTGGGRLADGNDLKVHAHDQHANPDGNAPDARPRHRRRRGWSLARSREIAVSRGRSAGRLRSTHPPRERHRRPRLTFPTIPYLRVPGSAWGRHDSGPPRSSPTWHWRPTGRPS